jgi:hypothetical protein
MKLNEISFLKVTRNVILVLFSMGWCFPIYEGIVNLFVWLYVALQPGRIEQGGKSFYIELRMISGDFQLGLYWLSVVCAFWAFVAACKIWSIKKKTKQSAEKN